MATTPPSTTDAYKNAPLVKESVDKVLALNGKKYSDIVSKPPTPGSVKELQWVDLVTAGRLLGASIDLRGYCCACVLHG